MRNNEKEKLKYRSNSNKSENNNSIANKKSAKNRTDDIKVSKICSIELILGGKKAVESLYILY